MFHFLQMLKGKVFINAFIYKVERLKSPGFTGNGMFSSSTWEFHMNNSMNALLPLRAALQISLSTITKHPTL